MLTLCVLSGRLWGQSANPSNRITIGRDTVIALTKAAAMSNTFKLKAFYLEQESFRKSEIIDSLKIKYSVLVKELSEQRLETHKMETLANKYKTQRNRDRTAIAFIVAFVSGYLLLSSKFAWLGRIVVWIKRLLGK